MKLGSVTKFDQKNKTKSKKKKKNEESKNCDIIVIFPSYGQFGTIQKPDYRRMVCKIYVLINSNILFYKT